MNPVYHYTGTVNTLLKRSELPWPQILGWATNLLSWGQFQGTLVFLLPLKSCWQNVEASVRKSRWHFPPNTSSSAGLGDPGAPNGERVGSEPAFCYNSAELPAALPALPQPGCSVVSSSMVWRQRTEPVGPPCCRRWGDLGMGVGNAPALFVQVRFFLALSFSLSYLSLCRSLSLLLVLVASVNSFSPPQSKNPPAFPGMSLGWGNAPTEENRLRMEQFSVPFSSLFSLLFLPPHPSW